MSFPSASFKKIRAAAVAGVLLAGGSAVATVGPVGAQSGQLCNCLLYTSDAADE